MPRDGSGIYTTPAGTTAVPDTTIESAKYNANVADVAADLNAPRPIVAGGTGATSAKAARTALGAEAMFVTVTNYDTHPWEAGSFISSPGATGSPEGPGAATGYWIGTAISDSAATVIGLEAINYSDPNKTRWERYKSGGTWTSWVAVKGGTFVGQIIAAPSSGTIAASATATGGLQIIGAGTAGDAAYYSFHRPGSYAANFGLDTDNAFKVGGASMGANAYRVLHEGLADPKVTDPLHVTSSTHARVFLEKAASGQVNAINGYTGPASVAANTRWSLQLGDSAAEGGSNTGSNLTCIRFNDAGASLGGAFDINRATGLMSIYNHLTVHSGGHTYIKINAAPGLASVVGGFKNSVNRWDLALGNQTPESGGNAGSDFELNRFSDAGAYLGKAFSITRSNGSAAFESNVTTTGSLIVNNSLPALYLQDPAGTPKIRLAHTLASGDTDITYGGVYQLILKGDGNVMLGVGFGGRPGSGGVWSGYKHNLNWTGTGCDLWVDVTNQGKITTTSDYRIKKDVADLPSTWEAVRALRPVSYTHAQYTPALEIEARKQSLAQQLELLKPETPEHRAQIEKDNYKGPMFTASDEPQWGFVAHEVQEALLPTAATGVKDQADAVQSLNLAPIVASLTKALQEAMARIEALEAAAAVPAR